MNNQSERHSLVIVDVHFEPDLTMRQLRGRLRLLVILKPTNRGHQNKRIPSWMSILKHPKIGSIVQQLQDDHRFSPDPFCALAEFKVLLHKAKKMTKRELSRQTPGCIGAKFSITSTALHA